MQAQEQQVGTGYIRRGKQTGNERKEWASGTSDWGKWCEEDVSAGKSGSRGRV